MENVLNIIILFDWWRRYLNSSSSSSSSSQESPLSFHHRHYHLLSGKRCQASAECAVWYSPLRLFACGAARPNHFPRRSRRHHYHRFRTNSTTVVDALALLTAHCSWLREAPCLFLVWLAEMLDFSSDRFVVLRGICPGSYSQWFFPLQAMCLTPIAGF